VNIYLILTLILSLLLLPVHYKTKKFASFWGIAMFILGFGSLFLRLSILKEFPLLGLFNKTTIILSSILIIAPMIVFMLVGIYSRHFRGRINEFKKLVLPYILFGMLQQTFFYFIFCDLIYYLTRSIGLTFGLTVLFFMTFHLTGWFPIKKLGIFLLIFATIGTWTYLVWGNIVPQLTINGLAGAVLYTAFTDSDQIKRRLGR